MRTKIRIIAALTGVLAGFTFWLSFKWRKDE